MKTFALFVTLLFCFCVNAQPPSPPYITGKTVGPLPFLQYSMGEDRLGAAKMTYLDTSIVVKIEDSVQEFYRLRLSNNHEAYAPKTSILKEEFAPLKSSYTTSSMKVFGDDKFDYLSLNLEERLPYRTIQQINPNRIVLEVFGAVSNTNWITQLKTAQQVKNVYYEQPEDDLFRVTIELKKNHFGYSVYYMNKTLMVKMKRQPLVPDLKKMLIAIDAGHGGENMGASGINTGILEKNYTLLIAKEVEKYLKKKGANVYMTREMDTTLDMVDRTLMLREKDPDFLISIHLNSSGSSATQGVSTYYRYIGFRPLSTAILDRMLELNLNNFGNVGGFNFSLSGPTEYPNCLVEVAFLSNAEDEKKIRDPKFHKAVAAKIYLGIMDWLKTMK